MSILQFCLRMRGYFALAGFPADFAFSRVGLPLLEDLDGVTGEPGSSILCSIGPLPEPAGNWSPPPISSGLAFGSM